MATGAAKSLAGAAAGQKLAPPGVLPYAALGTTNGLQIAPWLADAARRRQPVTLFATYASVGAVGDAHQVLTRFLGDTDLDPLDLIVCDEARRSSGSAEKSWTVVHDQDALPSLRRLYTTATPRSWAPPAFEGREEQVGGPLDPVSGPPGGSPARAWRRRRRKER